MSFKFDDLEMIIFKVFHFGVLLICFKHLFLMHQPVANYNATAARAPTASIFMKNN